MFYSFDSTKSITENIQALEKNRENYYLLKEKIAQLQSIKSEDVVIPPPKLTQPKKTFLKETPLPDDHVKTILLQLHSGYLDTLDDEDLYDFIKEMLPSENESNYQKVIFSLLIFLQKEKREFEWFIDQGENADFCLNEIKGIERLQKILQMCIKKEKLPEVKVQNKLLFLGSATKIFFLEDIEKIDPDYYERFQKLLNSLEDGSYVYKNWRRLSTVNGKISGVSEVKAFKTRIVFDEIENHQLVILGCFIKKDNWNKETFHKISNMKDKYESKYTIHHDCYDQVKEFFQSKIDKRYHI